MPCQGGRILVRQHDVLLRAQAVLQGVLRRARLAFGGLRPARLRAVLATGIGARIVLWCCHARRRAEGGGGRTRRGACTGHSGFLVGWRVPAPRTGSDPERLAPKDRSSNRKADMLRDQRARPLLTRSRRDGWRNGNAPPGRERWCRDQIGFVRRDPAGNSTKGGSYESLLDDRSNLDISPVTSQSSGSWRPAPRMIGEQRWLYPKPDASRLAGPEGASPDGHWPPDIGKKARALDIVDATEAKSGVLLGFALPVDPTYSVTSWTSSYSHSTSPVRRSISSPRPCMVSDTSARSRDASSSISPAPSVKKFNSGGVSAPGNSVVVPRARGRSSRACSRPYPSVRRGCRRPGCRWRRDSLGCVAGRSGPKLSI